ncbi:MAG: alpha/beta hydrolase [Elusimicrobia bacterium]|nr:alpha/beta hydrolase [Elusimicrobiota bacterium]
MAKPALFILALPFLLCGRAAAIDLNATHAADLAALASDMDMPAPQPPLAGVLTQVNGMDPIVITLPGLKFSEIGWGSADLGNFLKLIRRIFPHRDLTEADEAGTGFDARYFFPEEDEAGLEAEREVVRLPDNYLELKLQELPGYADHDVIVIPFTWSRDPGDTRKTVRRLQAKIIEVYDKYKDSGRPIYILAHSWGSVLAHTALHRVGKRRGDVRIDKLITVGSPLVPSNPVVKMFLRFEALKSGLVRKVRKPAVVGVWRNIWAMRDSFSNAIPAADSNYQVDAEVGNVEHNLIDFILHNKPLRAAARRDLFTIRNVKTWHGSYFYDYKAALKTLNREIFVPVFRPVLAPQVVDCGKDPASFMCPI